jgi:quinol monooxygenase YgiN
LLQTLVEPKRILLNFHIRTQKQKSRTKLVIENFPSIAAFREFAGRPHFTGALPGWEEVADFALDWALDPRALEPVTG